MRKLFKNAFAITFSVFFITDITTAQTDTQIDAKEILSETTDETTIIVPSRSVELQRNQYLDVVYPGMGWIYLGEADGTTLLKYSKREIGTDETIFTLQAKEEGAANLHFYKNDALTGSYIEDFLSVTVSGTSKTGNHIEAPTYADIVPPRPSFTQSTVVADALKEKAETAPVQKNKIKTSGSNSVKATKYEPVEIITTTAKNDDKTATVIQNTESQVQKNESSAKSTTENTAAKQASKKETSNFTEKEILDLAQKAYDAGNIEECLSYLSDFFEKSVTLTDKGYYLKGQALETPSPLRNIKQAFAAYKKVVSSYPESENWDDANNRLSYITRIYFDIR